MKRHFKKGTRFSVLGMGKSGIAAANFLCSEGFDVLISDEKEEKLLSHSINRLEKGVAVVTGRNHVRKGDVVVISPGIPPHSPVFLEAERNASELIGEIELFYRYCPAPIVAITGTDGKSTVTMLTGHILKSSGSDVHIGGNLGNPLTEMLGTLRKDSVVVAEISCFQLITAITFKPRVAAITNIAEDHTDYHGSFDNYVAAKKLILKNLGKGDCFVRNMDDSLIREWEPPPGARILEVSIERSLPEGIIALSGEIRLSQKSRVERIVRIEEMPIVGRHNVANASLSAGCAVAFGAELRAIEAGILTFKPLPHRIEPVGEIGGVIFLNDSKATNPHSAIAALNSLTGRIILISGGYDKGLELTQFADTIAAKVSRVILLKGSGASRLADLIKERTTAIWADDMARAVEAAYAAYVDQQAAEKSDSKTYILLSPGFSSFDRYGSYEERGEDFRKKVKELSEKISV